ncbi:8301_t:CDS:2 [Cetraspora pellucida]|uniref:8301_t:CDS:1 n=1 Tax=Cetraspora pellucida TaxID=1433469 RepID=A0A9N9FB45_9GLOM|nr:8301_t:CDS:2 [Cetraspora pellucida]
MYDKEPTAFEIQQIVAEPSGSTGSSNKTLKEDVDTVDNTIDNTIDNTEYITVPQVRPRKDYGIVPNFNRLSDRYTFSFSADLIAQFDKYRAQMRESIRQELEDNQDITTPESETFETLETAINDDDDGTFSVHQVHHSGSNMYSQGSTSREIDSAPKSNGRKPLIFSFLRGKTKSRRHITSSNLDNQSVSAIETSVIDNEDITMSNESDLRQSSHQEKTSLSKRFIRRITKLVTCS